MRTGADIWRLRWPLHLRYLPSSSTTRYTDSRSIVALGQRARVRQSSRGVLFRRPGRVRGITNVASRVGQRRASRFGVFVPLLSPPRVQLVSRAFADQCRKCVFGVPGSHEGARSLPYGYIPSFYDQPSRPERKSRRNEAVQCAYLSSHILCEDRYTI